MGRSGYVDAATPVRGRPDAMNWLGPKLEPGETIILRWWAGRPLLWLVALLLFVFLPIEFGLFVSGEENGLSLGRLFTLLPLAAISLLLAIVPILLLCGENF